MRQYDMRAMAEKILVLKETAGALKDISGGIQAVDRNVDRILSSVRLLELNIIDAAGILDEREGNKTKDWSKHHTTGVSMSAKEIRFHGRGGQGAVLAAKMLASAFALEGKCVASFPMYGFERRGMPVIAFTRFDEKPIREKTQIYTPDCLMVIDPGLLRLEKLFDGLKPNGTLILNSAKPLGKSPSEHLAKAGIINATQVALQELGRDIPNTCLMGALAAVTGWLKLESVIKGLGEYLEGDMLQKNIRNAERGFQEVEVYQW